MDMPAESAPRRVQLVTLTMNPALDITTSIDVVRPTAKMRCETTRYDPGGGGINVARVAHVLGASVSAVFTVGGPTGARVASLVRDEGVLCRQIEIAAQTRESFTVNENSSGQQYRFVLPGPLLSLPEQSRCLDLLRAEAVSADFVVASGSLPPGVPLDYYQRVSDICRDVGSRLVLDTSRGGLRHISSGVFLLKASVRELRECVGRPLVTESEQLAAAQGSRRKRLRASRPGDVGFPGRAPGDAAGEPAILGGPAAGRWEWRRGGRRDGWRNHDRPQSGVATRQIGSPGDSGGHGDVHDARYRGLYPNGSGRVIRAGRRAPRPHRWLLSGVVGIDRRRRRAFGSNGR